MELLDERSQVKAAIQRWIAKYGMDKTYGADKRGRKVGAELAELDAETATAEQVGEIIGNRSWACPRSCDECGQETWQLVQLGEEPDYESRTASICSDCLRAALRLLGAA
jgi:hypothetical protein